MTVREAYADAMRTTRREARNFAWGIMLLPKPKRQALAALYAFARRVDDIADGGLSAEERRALLGRSAAAVEALPRAPADDAVLVALADATVRYPIPKRAFRDQVAGGLMDVERTRYESWAELRAYCRNVAGAVGIACCAVYGPRDPGRARPLAETLGLALQQINIVRDVAEDWNLGRVYLPQDELRRFGVLEDDIAEGRTGPAWQALMAHQAARARALLAEGLTLLPLLDRRSALCVRTLAGVYAELLTSIERSRFEIFAARPRLGTIDKLRVVASGLAAGLGADGFGAARRG